MARQTQDFRSIVEVSPRPEIQRHKKTSTETNFKEPIYAIPISTTSAINIHMLFEQNRPQPTKAAPPTQDNEPIYASVNKNRNRKYTDSQVTVTGSSTYSDVQVITNGNTEKPGHSRTSSYGSISDSASNGPPSPPPLPPAIPVVPPTKPASPPPPETKQDRADKKDTSIIAELKAKQEALKAYQTEKQNAKSLETKLSADSDPPESEGSESATWTSLDDSHSEMSYSTSSSAGFDHDSACSVTGSEEREDPFSAERVALISDSSSAVLLQVTCDSEDTAKNNKFISLISDIANACANYFRKSESTQLTLDPNQINQLVLPDRRQVALHMKEAEKFLSENVSITKATCIRAKERQYIGTQVTNIDAVRGRCTLGQSAVIVLLKKLNKLACAEEFADQLCQHIQKARPTEIGSRKNLNSQLEKERKQKFRRKDQQDISESQLLGQTFLLDPTITIWEAAKRSFVDIEDFVRT